MNNVSNLIDELSADLSPTHPLCTVRLTLKWLGVSVIYGLIVGFVIGMRPDMGAAINDMHFCAEMGLCAIAAILGAFMAMHCAVPREHSRYFHAYPTALIVAVLGVLAFYSDISADALSHALSKSHVFGTLELLALSIVPIIYGVYLIRKAAPTAQRMAGAMLVLSSAMLANIIHHLTSTGMHGANQLFWCYTPVALLMVLGLIAGRRLLRW